MSFVEELRRRNVFKVAAVHAMVVSMPFAPAAHSQVNPGFEAVPPSASEATVESVPGWRVQGEVATIELDTVTRRSGARSLRIASQQLRGGSRFLQQVDVRGTDAERLRVSAYVRTSADTTGVAALRVWVRSPAGLTYIDRTDGPPAATGEWRRLEIEAPVAPAASELALGGELAGEGEVWFDDFTVEPVDLGALPAPSSAVSRYVAYALSVIDDHALVRAELDWPAYRAGVLRQARGAVSLADGYLALRHALGTLGDGHSHFVTADQTAALAESPVENARTRRPAIEPRAELIAGSIGYLRLPGFAGGSHIDRVEFAEGLQELVAELDAAAHCGWIVDLRDNSGGNLWPMIAGLGPLLGNGEVGASVWPDGARRRFWYEDGKVGLDEYVQLRVRGDAYRLRDAQIPIAVVTDEGTASAAEILAVAFAARPATRRFGETTRGATTATQTFPLIDGAALVLAVASTSDRHGRIYTGTLRPDEAVSAAERGLALAEQPAIRAAQRWLASRDGAALPPGCVRR